MEWKSERRSIEDLKPAKYNPRKINAKQKQDLTDSITTFNLVDPLIINADNTIIGGHQRYGLLKAKGVTEVDVRVPDRQLNDAEEKELNLRLNKNQGEFDLGLLTAFDPAMLVLSGFDGDMVDTIFEMQSSEDDYDVDKEVAKITQPKTYPGDVYVFPGGHRLMCGSSQNFDDLEKLMDGKQADLIFTDPPYNVAYQSPQGKGREWGKIKNDDMSDEDFKAWLTEVFKNAFIFSHDHVNVFCWFAMSNYTSFRAAIEGAGFKYMQVCFWLKDRFVLSMGQYFHRCTEPCMIFYRDWNKKLINMKYAKNHDVWQMDRLSFEESMEVWYQQRDANKDYQHPTQKPVRLGERAMKRNSEPGNIVLDMFGGGGGTLLCAHQLQRVCYMMELDPKYVQVVILRFMKMTGLEVHRVDSNGDKTPCSTIFA